jgi:hypothetical protein
MHALRLACCFALVTVAGGTPAWSQGGATGDEPGAEDPSAPSAPTAPPEPGPAQPAAPPAADVDDQTWYETIEADAFVSAAYGHNFAVSTQAAGANTHRAFDRDTDSFKLDVAALTLELAGTEPGEGGFRLDLAYGMIVPRVLEGGPVAVLQAYASYMTSWRLRVDVGTFLSHMTAEAVEVYDAYNLTYSRGLQFTHLAPPLLTGVRLVRDWGGTQATVFVVNGWEHNRLDNNSAKSFGARLVFSAKPYATFSLAYMTGPEKADNAREWRQLINANLLIRPNDALATGLEATYGVEASGARTTPWLGLGAVFDVSGPRCGAAVRLEYVDDHAGFAGFSGKVMEITVAPRYRFADEFLVRADLRQDRGLDGLEPFFGRRGATAAQTTIALNAILSY